MITVRLSEDTHNRLSALALSSGRTKSSLVREALAEQLNDIEDYQIAVQQLADIKAGRSKTYPLEEVMARFGLEV